MIAGSQANPRGRLLNYLSGTAALLSVLMVGCGPSEETVDELEAAPEVTPTAKMEYRVDSLMNENRRLHDQAEAIAAENRRLTAKNAELETRLTEAAATPKPTTPVVATPSRPTTSRPAKGSVSPKPMPSGDASSAYNAALNQFRSRNYAAAAEGFQAILDGGGDPGLTDNCTYWIGESYYGMGKYSEAMKQFESVMSSKGSGKKPDALFMIGNCQASLGNSIAAKETYQKVINVYPDSWLIGKAKDRLAKLK